MTLGTPLSIYHIVLWFLVYFSCSVFESREIVKFFLISAQMPITLLKYRAWQTIYSPQAKPGHYLFLYDCELRMISTFLNGWKEIKGRIFSNYTWKLCEIKISASINKVCLEYSHVHSFSSSLVALVLQQQNWVFAAEILWLEKPEKFTVWYFTGPLFYSVVGIIISAYCLNYFTYKPEFSELLRSWKCSVNIKWMNDWPISLIFL